MRGLCHVQPSVVPASTNEKLPVNVESAFATRYCRVDSGFKIHCKTSRFANVTLTVILVLSIYIYLYIYSYVCPCATCIYVKILFEFLSQCECTKLQRVEFGITKTELALALYFKISYLRKFKCLKKNGIRIF